MGMFANPKQVLKFEDVVNGDGVLRVRRRQALNFGDEPSRTKQEFLEASDINNIMKRYQVTHLVPQLQRQPMYGDFTALPSYQETLNSIIRVQQAFAALPSSVRDRFYNDPDRFIEFITKPENEEEVRKMGLLKERVAPDATLNDVVDAVKASGAERSEATPPSEPPSGGVTK